MIIFSKYGAMYIELEGEIIDKENIELGDGLLKPNQYLERIGEKKRSSFEMSEDCYLKYEGTISDDTAKYLLFSTNVISFNKRADEVYYAFSYIDKNTLLVQNPIKHSAHDIRINHLETYDEVKIIYLEK